MNTRGGVGPHLVRGDAALAEPGPDPLTVGEGQGADGGDDEPVHILRIISENLDVNEAEFEGLDDDELIDTIYQIFRERNDLDD